VSFLFPVLLNRGYALTARTILPAAIAPLGSGTISDTTHFAPIDFTAFSASRRRLGKGEVASSILAGSTINLLEIIAHF
jgi:hypothetical protein